MTKILVVDDEKITRDYIKFVINENNKDTQVIEARNGLEAIKKAKEYNPQIVIIDIRMPEMDGLEAAKRIKKILRNCKIIILTAHNEFTYAQNAVKIRIDDYLLKPISPAKLLEALQEYICTKSLDDDKYQFENEAKIPISNITPMEKNIEIAKEYIKNNYSKKICLEDVAKKSGYSYFYFSKLFKKYTGLSFNYYLNKIRVEQAKKLISNYDLSLREISEKVGYEDCSYFSGVFKKYEGILPSEYRNIIANK